VLTRPECRFSQQQRDTFCCEPPHRVTPAESLYLRRRFRRGVELSDSLMSITAQARRERQSQIAPRSPPRATCSANAQPIMTRRPASSRTLAVKNLLYVLESIELSFLHARTARSERFPFVSGCQKAGPERKGPALAGSDRINATSLRREEHTVVVGTLYEAYPPTDIFRNSAVRSISWSVTQTNPGAPVQHLPHFWHVKRSPSAYHGIFALISEELGANMAGDQGPKTQGAAHRAPAVRCQAGLSAVLG